MTTHDTVEAWAQSLERRARLLDEYEETLDKMNASLRGYFRWGLVLLVVNTTIFAINAWP